MLSCSKSSSNNSSSSDNSSSSGDSDSGSDDNSSGGGGSNDSGGGSDDNASIIHTKFVKDIMLSGEEYCDSKDKKLGITICDAEDYCASSIDIKQTDDGGYIIAGCKDDSAWLMKTDVYGEKQWEKTYGLGDYWGDRTVIQTSDGGYLFAGWEGVLKTDSSGTKLWQKKGVPGKPSQNPYYEDVIEHSNGNYYLVGGPVGGLAILVKIDQSGAVKKTKFYGGNCEDDLFRSIIESNDGKLIMVGEKGHGNQSFPCSFNFRYYKDIWVVKTGTNGAVIWQKTYGGDYLEKGMDIVRRDSDGYIVVGQKCKHNYNIKSCGPITKVVILKINEDGKELDETLLSGLSFYEAGRAMALANTHSGGYVFVTEPRDAKKNLWIKKWGSNEKNEDIKISPGGLGGESIMRTNDNGFIISTAGGTIIKTDSNLSY